MPGLDTLLLTTANPGRYTAAIELRQFGVTFRMDFQAELEPAARVQLSAPLTSDASRRASVAPR